MNIPVLRNESWRKKILSKKGGSTSKKDLSFLQTVLEMSRRGDIDEIQESLKLYFQDKKKYPWHRLYSTIYSNISEEKEQSNAIMLVRDAFFGAFNILSLSLALNIPTQELITVFTKEKSFKEARKQVRSYCVKFVSDLIQKKDVFLLNAESLVGDGFGYLVPELFDAELDVYRKGRPDVKSKKTESGQQAILDLKKLLRSKIGRKLLRDQLISETAIPLSDDRAAFLLEAYDLLLVELELKSTERSMGQLPTEQTTLNGKVVELETLKRGEAEKDVTTPGVQTHLTEYIKTDDSKRPKKKERERAAEKRKKKQGGKAR